MSILSQPSMETQTFPAQLKELQDLQKVSFNTWCQSIAQHGFKYRILQVSQQVVNYLQQDGVFTQEGEGNGIFGPPREWDQCDQWSEDESSEFEDRNTNVEGVLQKLQISKNQSQNSKIQENSLQIDEVRKLKIQIDDYIQELGGKVIPKLNWSAPIDALWVNQNQLYCQNSDEVMMLLQCSDRVGHDLDLIQQIQKINPEFQCDLVLKKSGNLLQDQEFRCFVRGGQLIGICQRHIDQYFGGLNNQKLQIQYQIQDFFQKQVINLKESIQLPDFVFDVYVLSANQKVVLTDISIVGGSTQPLLFDWDELYGDNKIDNDLRQEIDFRLVKQAQEGIINKGQAIYYGVPYEFSCGSDNVLADIAEQAKEWWRNNSN